MNNVKIAATLLLAASFIGVIRNSANAALCDEVKSAIRVKLANASNFVNDWRKLSEEAKTVRGKEQENEMVQRMDAVLIPALRSIEGLVDPLDKGLYNNCFDDKGRLTALEMRQRLMRQLKKGKETGIPF